MKTRAITADDLYWAMETHRLHYDKEFPFPDIKKFDSAFTIVTEDDVPVIVGGVKAIAEVIIITDKNFSVKERREALHKTLEASGNLAALSGFNQIHCAIQDPVYEKHLLKLGFRPVKGSFLYLNVGESNGKR
jgi:hypothetical protein